MPVPINYNPSTISQTRILAPEFELQNPLYTEVAKPLPYFDPAKYLSADTKAQAPFVRPDSNLFVDPLASFNEKLGKNITFESKAEGDLKGVGNVTYNTGDLDSMLAAAEKLLASDKPSDQQRGMLLMQRQNQLFMMRIELDKVKHNEALSAINGIKG